MFDHFVKLALKGLISSNLEDRRFKKPCILILTSNLFSFRFFSQRYKRIQDKSYSVGQRFILVLMLKTQTLVILGKILQKCSWQTFCLRKFPEFKTRPHNISTEFEKNPCKKVFFFYSVKIFILEQSHVFLKKWFLHINICAAKVKG